MHLVEVPKKIKNCDNLIGAQWLPATRRSDVVTPYTGERIGSVCMSAGEDVNAAVAAAKAAFPKWRTTPLKERTQILFRFRDLLLQHADELANLAALEAGKTRAEAKAGILKGVEVSEFALSLQNLDSGAAMEVSRGVACEFRREPLGVVCGITPFNFPAMVPLWLFPIAVTVGNCFILKPSEKVPLTPTRLGELMLAAGYPPGVFSIIHGGKEAVEALAVNSDVKALAFVGSTPVAKKVYATAATAGKRALCLGGAKNFSIIVPDAEEKVTVQGIVDSFTGCAGQRCMALSLAVAVGEVDHIVQKITAKASSIELGNGMGAIIDKAAWQRINDAIEEAAKQGAKILLDGRKASPPKGYNGGFWLGPTVIDHAQPNMACVRTEIFGPVLTIVRKKTLGEAVCMENGNVFGNATSVFTTNGAVARYVAENASAGMVGVNIGVPVPREPFSFGGTKESKFGHGDITGVASLNFWTDLKKITTKWSQQEDANWMN